MTIALDSDALREFPYQRSSQRDDGDIDERV